MLRCKEQFAKKRPVLAAAAVFAGSLAIPAQAETIRVDFEGAVDALVSQGGTTRDGNVFGVDGGSTYSGFVEFEYDVLVSEVGRSPFRNADGRTTAVQFGAQQDPSIRFGFSVGNQANGQNVFTHNELDASFNDPLLTFGVAATVTRVDPDGPGPERPFDVVNYGSLEEFFLEGVTLLSDPVTVSNQDLVLVFLNEPSIGCPVRHGSTGQDCFVSSGVSGEIGNDTFGVTEVGLGTLTQSSADGITVVPIPAALPLLASGLGLLSFASWRRRARG